MKHENDELIKLSRQLLDDSLDELDDSILLRLRQSRQMALKAAMQTSEKSSSLPVFEFPNWLAPVSAGATFATVALTFILFGTQPLPQQAPNILEDIELLSQGEELEFYQNLDFYIWLEDETTG